MSDVPRPAPVRPLAVEFGNAICYSGYRKGQSPRTGVYPSHDQVKEDLEILATNWTMLRLYDSSRHAEIVLDVIEAESMNFKVMLGAELAAELSNPNCPWDATFDAATLAQNRARNDAELDRTVALADRYRDIVMSVAVGNEATVEWTDHLVSVDRMIDLVRRARSAVTQPVTSCDNYVPWTDKLVPLGAEVDFISIHTYPVWEHQPITNALAFTRANYRAVVDAHPDKLVVITEAGWPTASNGRGIDPANASEALQARYYEELLAWTTGEQILTFVFEAFDEPWKGSPHPLEPEKHWGLFYVNRTPKPVMRSAYADLVS